MRVPLDKVFNSWAMIHRPHFESTAAVYLIKINGTNDQGVTASSDVYVVDIIDSRKSVNVSACVVRLIDSRFALQVQHCDHGSVTGSKIFFIGYRPTRDSFLSNNCTVVWP